MRCGRKCRQENALFRRVRVYPQNLGPKLSNIMKTDGHDHYCSRHTTPDITVGRIAADGLSRSD